MKKGFEFAGKSRRKSDAESILRNYPGGYMEQKGVEFLVFRPVTKELRGNALGHGEEAESEKPERRKRGPQPTRYERSTYKFHFK